MGSLYDMLDQMYADILRLTVEEYIDIMEYKMTEEEQDSIMPFMIMKYSPTFKDKRELIAAFAKYRNTPRILSHELK